MSSNKISDSKSLTMQILLLKAERKAHEEELDRSFTELKQLIFNPGSLSNNDDGKKLNTTRDLIKLSKVVLNMGANYLIEQKFGKRQKWNDFITSVIFELVSIPLVNRGIKKLFFGSGKQQIGETGSAD